MLKKSGGGELKTKDEKGKIRSKDTIKPRKGSAEDQGPGALRCHGFNVGWSLRGLCFSTNGWIIWPAIDENGCSGR